MTLILNGTDNSATTPAVTGTDTDTGVYYPAANQVALATNGTLALMVDANRNIGLKVTPNASWPSSWSVLETLGGNNLWGIGGQVQLGYNNYYDGSAYKYAGTYRGSRAMFTDSGFYIESSPVGTAGATVTFETQLQLQYQNTLALRGASSVAGTGITFPATQSASSDANTLDDYEEGTFTPTVLLGATSNSIGTATGTYTKIGNVVFFACRMENVTKAGTGNLTMGGLPFAASSAGNQNRYSQFLVRWTGINSGGVIIGLASVGNPSAEFQNFTTTGGYSGAVSDGSISAAYSIYGVSGHYYTNT